MRTFWTIVRARATSILRTRATIIGRARAAAWPALGARIVAHPPGHP